MLKVKPNLCFTCSIQNCKVKSDGVKEIIDECSKYRRIRNVLEFRQKMD